MLELKNGQGLTPLELLQAYVAEADQLTGFRSLGITNAEACGIVIDGVEYRGLTAANAHLREEKQRMIDKQSAK
jgi:hypothetical protein